MVFDTWASKMARPDTAMKSPLASKWPHANSRIPVPFNGKTPPRKVSTPPNVVVAATTTIVEEVSDTVATTPRMVVKVSDTVAAVTPPNAEEESDTGAAATPPNAEDESNLLRGSNISVDDDLIDTAQLNEEIQRLTQLKATHEEIMDLRDEEIAHKERYAICANSINHKIAVPLYRYTCTDKEGYLPI